MAGASWQGTDHFPNVDHAGAVVQMINYLVVVVLLLLIGLFLLWLADRARRQLGLPAGKVIYDDAGAWQQVEQPLRSSRFGLVGRPDYLVQVVSWGRTMIVPVEVKSRKRPAPLPESHLLQLAAYCLLVEDHFQKRPPYGLLRYADATIKIPFTDALRNQTLAAVAAIHQARGAAEVVRSHDDAARCRRCGYLLACGGQALVQPPR
jgi:CRISPR-associated exonuclease Cas4